MLKKFELQPTEYTRIQLGQDKKFMDIAVQWTDLELVEEKIKELFSYSDCLYSPLHKPKSCVVAIRHYVGAKPQLWGINFTIYIDIQTAFDRINSLLQ